MTTTKQKGDLAEKRAISFLEENNYTIIETNFYAKKLGEIDIIASKNRTYHFIEVKSANDYETAVNNITPSKLSKLKRSIDYFIQTKNINSAYCIDVVIVTPENIEYLENITL
ncbi:MAG: YraN family protein [Sulfurovum sp.]|jgi:putative endonuclease